MGGSSLSMALFLSLWDSRHACMDDWVERQRIAEVDRDRLTRAAVTIQSIRRGCVRRRQVREMRTACIVLQRIWRGFISREVATYDSMLRDKKRAQMLWYLAARTIQKTFRAFYSRRYRHSYYERQAYLSAVATKDNKIREVSEQVAESMFIERTTLHEATERNNFDKLAADLHHLKSTEHISKRASTVQSTCGGHSGHSCIHKRTRRQHRMQAWPQKGALINTRRCPGRSTTATH